MKESKINPDDFTLVSVKDAALDLFKKSKGVRIILNTPNGYHIEIGGKEERESNKDSQAPVVLDKLAFSEASQYIQEAKARFDTKTAVGYSGCKTNCRNALMSALKTLTGKEEISEATKELGKQGILGKREEEFIEIFGKLLVKLHGLASKKGPHPPMTIEEDDAELVLDITTAILNYVTNQAVKRTG